MVFTGLRLLRSDMKAVLASVAVILGFVVESFATESKLLVPASGLVVSARSGTSVRPTDGGGYDIDNDGTYRWPGVEISREDGDVWDLSRVGVVEVVVSNRGDRAEMISADVFPLGANRDQVPLRSSLVPPGEIRLISVQLADSRLVTDVPVRLQGMTGVVRSQSAVSLNYGKTSKIEVFQCLPEGQLTKSQFSVLSVRTSFEAAKPKLIAATNFFPFVDRYGQLKHLEWPGKIHSDAELRRSRGVEEAWLDAHAESPIQDSDRFGGWSSGPKLRASGYFRTEKVGGKWWLVDPDGHLFFSLGVTCVYADNSTPITGREDYFEWVPDSTVPGWWFFEPEKRAMFNFIEHNELIKYGSDWKTHFAETAHRRFRSWGINTIGNWSHEYVWKLRRTPYVATIDCSSETRIRTDREGQFGRPVPDVFSPGFVADIRARLGALAAKIKDDPWCVGVFIDNELAWTSLSEPEPVAERYFSTIASEFKRALPNHLYLGCRFAWADDPVWRAASRHCDVVSFNFYERRPTKDLPSGSVDKPLIVGEFHFGALDRGMLGSACAPTFDQQERAHCFADFVNDCLDRQRIVGCHWFQYQDQALTGRLDGENLQIGFTSVCDVPYPELVASCRATAREMYLRRFSGRR